MTGTAADADPGLEESVVGTEALAVFELLADESRFAILRALRKAGDQPLGYSELRRRADIDDSARFNYHLMRMTDTLVADVDGGYELREEAELLLDTVLASSLFGGSAGRTGHPSADDHGPAPLTDWASYSD